MRKRAFALAVLAGAGILLSLAAQDRPAAPKDKVFPGADENTLPVAHFFTWINNTAGGSPEAQTFINLDFFKWLRDEYGMRLDSYAFDADILDGGGKYYNLTSPKFLKNYPASFGPVAKAAGALGIRLGVWLGPDGFGDTPEEEKERITTLVSLARDFNFRVLKMDTVSKLRPEKQDAFIRAMKEARTYAPDLIVLNHRIDFGKAAPYVTTTLWNGDESYIDVHMVNAQTAPHHRVAAISRGLTPRLTRLMEDHGVCLSSCLDYWEDDLVMQAFGRCLLLAPELYGNPWFLRDDEYPRLARLFNLHRRYRDILIKGFVLPADQYGPSAVSRGDEATRLLTLGNLTWNPTTCDIALDESIGLKKGGTVTLVQFHPYEKILGRFGYGAKVPVEVLPFRACLLLATTSPSKDVGLEGANYEVVRDVPGKDVVIKVLGYPGSRARIMLTKNGPAFDRATLDGGDVSALLAGRDVEVAFPGGPLKQPWHRKLGDLKPASVPDDAQALYEATCFAADNDALEVRSLRRSGTSNVPQVRKARDAFFNQPVFVAKGVWDKNLFDGDLATSFNVWPRWRDFKGGALRVDFGRAQNIETLVIKLKDGQAAPTEAETRELTAEVSADLKTWTPVRVAASGTALTAAIDPAAPVRYFRLSKAPDKIAEIEGTLGGKSLDRSAWRASNLFGWYGLTPAVKAWTLSFTLDESVKGGYLVVPLAGKHGREGAFAALRAGGRLIGAPDRAVSFPTNVWEFRVEPKDSDYTYYIPVTQDMVGRRLDVVVLGLNKDLLDFKPEVWMTAYPIPFEQKELVLLRGK
jgi:hypothetical protein